MMSQTVISPICLLRQDRNREQISEKSRRDEDEEWRFYGRDFPYVKSFLLDKNQNRPLLVRQKTFALTW